MSLTEIKDSIAELSVEERLDVAAWIVYLSEAGDLKYQEGLDRRMSAMDAGRKSTRQELERLHADMDARGQASIHV